MRGNDIKLKCRIIRDFRGFYIGEVLLEDSDECYDALRHLSCGLEMGWNRVTERCITRLGCKLAIKIWKKNHYIEYFDM